MYSTKSEEQPSRGVLRKRCSENIQQIYKGTLMPKCDFNNIFRTPFTKNTSERLLLKIAYFNTDLSLNFYIFSNNLYQ